MKQNSVSLGDETKKPLSEEDILKKIQDEKFKGNCFRMDGKKITENQVKTFVKYFYDLMLLRKKTSNKRHKRIHMIPVKTD